MRVFVALAAIFLLFANINPSVAADKVTLQLRWDHQFQFAGYYAALWQGYYADAGLEVEIRSAVTPERKILRAINEVGEGRADFGIGAADILVGIDKGYPLVVVAPVFQSSAATFYALADTQMNNPADLLNLKVARRVNDLIDVELQAMLRAEGIDPAKVTPYPHEPGWDHFFGGRVDVIPAYNITTPFNAQRLGYAVKALRPATYGVDFYGDTLFTNRSMTEDKPDLVLRFKEASLKGWEYALQHPGEIIDRAVAELPRNSPQPNLKAFNQFQSDGVRKLTLFPLMKLGQTNPDRWRRMNETLKASGLIKADFDAGNSIFDPEAKRQAARGLYLRIALIVIGASVLVVLGFVAWTRVLHTTVSTRTASLTESEEQFRILFENMAQGVFFQQADGTLSRANSATLRMFGLTNDQFLGRTSVDPNWRVVREDGSDLPGEEHPSMLALKTGKEIRDVVAGVFNPQIDDFTWLNINAIPRFNNGEDEPFEVFVTLHDITERKRIEETLRESEARFRMLYERAPLGYQSLNIDGEFIEVNQAWLDMFGYSREEVIGQDFQKFLAAENFVKKNLPRFLEAGEIELPVTEMLCKDGTTKIIHIDGKIGTDEAGEFLQTHCILADVTDRKRAEAAILESRESFRQIVELSPVPMAITDLEGYIKLFNSKFISLFGWTTDDINTPEEWWHSAYPDPAYREMVAASWEKAMAEAAATNTEIAAQQWQLTCKNGDVRDVVFQMIPIPGDLSVIAMHDITELKAMEHQLVQSQKMEAVGQLTGGVAHDFNNLLQVVQGNLDMVKDTIPKGSKAEELVNGALRAGRRGAQLTQQLLAFSRKQTLSPENVAPHSLVDGMTKLLSRTLGEDISIETQFANDVANIIVDENGLTNAILNLALNARAAMPKGGTLTVAINNQHIDTDVPIENDVLPSGDYVEIAVTDTGCGISEDDLSHVFEPFFTTKEVGEGSGMGLSMVYGFARQSGGNVTIESELGKGTTVRLTLPSADGETASVDDAQTARNRNYHEIKVLLVEDDEDVRDSAVMLLKSLGCEVIEAENAAPVFDILEQDDSIDLLLSDVVLPGGKNGIELAQDAVRLRPGLSVVLVSGYPERILEKAGLTDAGFHLLRKPFSKEALSEALGSAMT